jgi:DNA repair exonuclease SbcCD ATPase subunit
MPQDDQLYVKLDKQAGLKDELRNVQGTVANVNEALEVLRNVRSVREDAIQKVYENLAHLQDSLQNIEQEMPGVENSQSAEEIEGRVETPEIDGSVQELHSELETLQEELSQLD